MTQIEKADFLKVRLPELLAGLDATSVPKWGKMNVQQMVEHLADYVRIANGKTLMEVVTDPDRLPKMQGFLMSEKPFPENTPNVLMPDTPPPVRHSSMNDAISELRGEIDYFFEVYDADAEKKLNNPFFGLLDRTQQIQLLHKHASHHLRQFGITDSDMMVTPAQ